MDEKIFIKDLFKRLLKYKIGLAVIMVGAVSFLISLSFVLPKTYQSSFEINIYSKYFKNGIISEVVPGVSSPKEMTDTIDSMIKEVISDEYIDQLGIEYKFYSDLRNTEVLQDYNSKYLRARERMLLRSKFKFFSTGVQSYKLLFSDKDPLVALEVTMKVLEEIKGSFIEKRIKTIEMARNSLLNKLESLNLTSKITDDEIASNALASRNPQVLKSELLKLEKDIKSLSKQFNENHPRIRKLINRKKTILNWLKDFNATEISEEGEYTDAPLIMSGDKKVAAEIASKIYIKYNNINIALEIEKRDLNSYIGVIQRPQLPVSPIFPKKRIFASLGFILGLALCFIYIFYKEVISLRNDDYILLLTEKIQTTYVGDLDKEDASSAVSSLYPESSTNGNRRLKNVLHVSTPI